MRSSAAFAPRHLRGEVLDRARQVERALVDQRIEQVRAARELLGERRREREHADQLVEQARARVEQAEQVDRARCPGDQIFPQEQRAARVGCLGERIEQARKERIERGARRPAAERTDMPVAPARDPLGQRVGLVETKARQPRWQALARAVFTGRFGLVEQAIVAFGNSCAERAELVQQRGSVGQSVEPGDAVERLARWNAVRLVILQHLDPVLDSAQPVVASPEQVGILSGDVPRRG